MKQDDGSRLRGNELNSLTETKFLYEPTITRYPGTVILWKIMQPPGPTEKKQSVTPSDIYIAGKTGSYHGSNESRSTIKHEDNKARNHATVLNINGKYYSLLILSNTGQYKNVAVLAGGLMREHLDVDKGITLRNNK